MAWIIHDSPCGGYVTLVGMGARCSRRGTGSMAALGNINSVEARAAEPRRRMMGEDVVRVCCIASGHVCTGTVVCVVLGYFAVYLTSSSIHVDVEQFF